MEILNLCGINNKISYNFVMNNLLLIIHHYVTLNIMDNYYWITILYGKYNV